jgi:hypothetical protein
MSEIDEPYRNSEPGRSWAEATTSEYDPVKDAHDSYYAAIEAKRLRGDASKEPHIFHFPDHTPSTWKVMHFRQL